MTVFGHAVLKVAIIAPRDEHASETIQTLPTHRDRYSG